MKRIVLGSLGVLAALIIIGAATSGSHPSGSASAITTPPIVAADPPSDAAPQAANKPADNGWNDVTLLDCTTRTDSFMTEASANVRIVNHTDSTQSYMIEVGLNNTQGKRISTATAVSNSLPSGRSVTVTGNGFPDGAIPGMRCELANVTRIPG